MKNIRPFPTTILATATVALALTTARADTAANIQTYANNSGATYDGGGYFPIITAILTAPVGSLDGYTYNNWAFLAQDPTGSLDMFYANSLTTGSAWIGLGGTPGYTPHVGDAIVVQGNYTPFDGIPEIGNSSNNPVAVTYSSSGNPFYTPSPTVTTISTINVGTNAYGLNASGLAGTYLTLKNVTIGTNGNFPIHANLSTTISDGANSMTAFFWASSYSTIGAMGGTPIPQGLVNITGFVDDFGNTAEFVPISVTAVPEPTAVGLGGLAAALAWASCRLRKKA